MFVCRKRSLMKRIKNSILTTTVERQFSVLTFLSTKLGNTLAANSLDKLMQLISMEPHIYDLDRDEINDLEKFLKNPHSVVLSSCNLTIHI